MIEKGGFMMTKQQLNENIKELYIMNQSLEESNVKKHHKNIYKEATTIYGTWGKALRNNAVTKRKLKENQKFMLYAIMKKRNSDYGHEALRPLNIEDEIKDKIVESYKTLKALKDIITGTWTQDKVLYEMRIQFLTGSTVERFEQEHPSLYEQAMEYFNDFDEVIEEYDKRFGTPSITAISADQGGETNVQTSEVPQKMVMGDDQLDELANTMVRMKYIEKPQDLFNIQEAQSKEKEDISSYLFKMIVDAQQNNQKLSMKKVYSEDPVMYFAIKIHYGDLETAINSVKSQLSNIVVAG